MTSDCLLCIAGATASGKTRLAVKLADVIDGEIISADARQVYRKMDVGTGKDLDEYTIGTKKIPYHLIDIVDAGRRYDVYQYQCDFQRVYQDIVNRGKTPVLCGGSGMYLEAVLGNYALEHVPVDEEFRKQIAQYSDEQLIRLLKQHKTLHNTSDITDRERLIRALEIALHSDHCQSSQRTSEFPLQYKLFYVFFERSVLRERIALRLQQRLQNGLVEEVQSLLDYGISSEDLCYYGLEYRFITQYLTGHTDYQTMVSTLTIAIGQFAKRQQTWFRRMERKGFELITIDGSLSDEQKLKKIVLNCDLCDDCLNSDLSD
ncbi:MAG: tRNA (adenosine(37)-N6)-dimethylallyltransferase MiaA [Bacteroidales bacterium]|jgi:tRNA dimethylallyltransferase|nr:tRNA (adenosine(37)-N6)-dimethylallyltransferase MiaA [Bacteroidales bacterium]